MKRVVTIAPRLVEIQEGLEPTVGPNDALLSVEAVGICGSDIHFYTGDHPYSHFPTVQGHEFAARVMNLPDGYDGPIRIGQRVAVEPSIVCGECLPCRRGRGNACLNIRTLGIHIDGGLAERIAVPVHLLHDVGGLPADLAALVEPVAIGVHAIARSGLRPADRAVVFGAGPIGLAILLAGRAAGASFLVVDRLDSRLALARSLGADLAVNAVSEPTGERVAEWTSHEGPTVVFEATGVPTLLRQAVDIVAPTGTVVVIGLSNDDVAIPMISFTRKELTVVGSRNSMGEFGQAARLIAHDRALAARLITHHVSLDDAPDAFELALTAPETTEKVIIQVGDVRD